MTLIYVLLVGHFYADFVCQSGWMALNKSCRWDALIAHVAVYVVVLLAVLSAAGWGGDGLVAFALLNGAAHFVTDAVTSRVNGRLYSAFPCDRSHHWFFVGVGVDQLIHYVTLFVTAGWWLR